MDEFPLVTICLVTYRRTEEALKTIRSTIKNLVYPYEFLAWYIADDGSNHSHREKILDVLAKEGQRVIGCHSERLRHQGQEDTHNAGIGWNKGLGLCHQASDFVLFLEDDWELDEPLNLKPFVHLLGTNEDIGMVSFRILSAGNEVKTVGYDGIMYLKYLRTTQYSYSGNPSLRHARFTRAYGWFAEDRNPGNIELALDDVYRTKPGPDIVRPVDISVWGAWKHIGTEKSWR